MLDKHCHAAFQEHKVSSAPTLQTVCSSQTKLPTHESTPVSCALGEMGVFRLLKNGVCCETADAA